MEVNRFIRVIEMKPKTHWSHNCPQLFQMGIHSDTPGNCPSHILHPSDMGLIRMGRKLETEQKFTKFLIRWKQCCLGPLCENTTEKHAAYCIKIICCFYFNFFPATVWLAQITWYLNFEIIVNFKIQIPSDLSKSGSCRKEIKRKQQTILI